MLTQASAVASFYRNFDESNVQKRVEDHLVMVKKIAYHLKSKLPEQVLVDDLIQAGMVGLIEASKKFDADQGASFETYAGIRVRGAMLDEIRKNDWTPRSVHRNTRMVAEVVARIENKKGRQSTDCEIATELGIELDEYHAMLLDSSTHRVLSFEDFSINEESVVENIPNHQPLLLDGVQHQDLKEKISTAINELPNRDKMVMSLYYFEELNLREIGAILSVSESRVSQIHSQAMIRLQVKLKEIINETRA